MPSRQRASVATATIWYGVERGGWCAGRRRWSLGGRVEGAQILRGPLDRGGGGSRWGGGRRGGGRRRRVRVWWRSGGEGGRGARRRG